MFTLLACVQKQFAANRNLYVAFIDFEKAFDSIKDKFIMAYPVVVFNESYLDASKVCTII